MSYGDTYDDDSYSLSYDQSYSLYAIDDNQGIQYIFPNVYVLNMNINKVNNHKH